MRNTVSLKITIGLLVTAGAAAWIVATVASCGTAPTPFVIRGPGRIGNEPPTLNFLEPTTNITVSQGERFLLRWTDTDRDDNALINFALINVTTNARVVLVEGIEEDDIAGPDNFTVSTALLPKGTYHILGTIDDGHNPPVEAYAMATGTAVPQRLVVTIVGPGEGPQTKPPVIIVTQPSYNLSVTQDDVLRVSVQPTALPPSANLPYDPDSRVTLYILLDVDQDPNNDEPANPDPSKIIVLSESSIAAGDFGAIAFDISIDLAVVLPRPAGEPYYIRATAYDATNPPVHSYAPGTIAVVRLAEGIVDLFDIGRTKSGAKIYGFNPDANLGSSLSYVGDFDADGVDDFVLVARFGNPQNAGPVGEGYLIYGQGSRTEASLIVGPGNRFGGSISVNSISDTISGVVFHAPPVRVFPWEVNSPTPRTDGITSISFVRDLTGDGRPELLFGLPHVHNAFDSMDYDPEDTDPTDINAFGCYPDLIVNNVTGTGADVQFYSGGMTAMVNSQNRDISGLVNTTRLESTVVNLELVGQKAGWILDRTGLSNVGSIFPRAANTGTDNLGNDSDEAGRISGARFIGGGYDSIDAFGLQQPPREDLFGQTVASLGDLNADGLDELIISAPRNERYIKDLEGTTYSDISTHLGSTVFFGSIVVLPGANYNQTFWRDLNSEDGTSGTPALDQYRWEPFGRCTGEPSPRGYEIPADYFPILAEHIDDMLGGGRSAGDFNQDGVDDILCAAPRNDRTESLADTGAVYVIYGRTIYGEVRLSDADDPVLRPPMLRIKGSKPGDQLGWRATAGLDVNGDRVDDMFISSPRTDFGPVARTTCGTDFGGDGVISQSDFILRSFSTCQETAGQDVFSDDSCKAFDYDNDGDIDDDDRCVFCCLSEECDAADTCIFGRGTNCCENLVDNGFVGIVFGGVFIDGDRDISQLATSELPGTIFYGDAAGYRAGYDVSSAGDFNQDGFGDILIAAPGEVREDSAGRERLGVVYLIFGGTHLINTTWSLRDVGSGDLPGIVFISPYVKGRPNEAAPMTVGFIGDVNKDGFGDIAIGSPKADFIDLSFPQGPDAPGSDAAVGRRRDVGNVYVIYGNNFGRNRGSP